MKRQKIGILSIASMLLLGSSMVHAGAQAPFDITPVSGTTTSFILPNNFTETLSYIVTNQTKITRTLTMVPMQAVTQDTSTGKCSSPFTLAPQQSCILTLSINGSQLPASGVSGGPVICKTRSPNNNNPDLFLCAKPLLANTLTVSVFAGSGQHAYVADQLSNSVTFCQSDPVTGFLSQCAVTATGLGGLEAIAFSPSGNFFYSANVTGNSVSVCNVNQLTGALSGCVDSGGTGFDFPDGLGFSADGSILYASNIGGLGSVSACLVNQTTGRLSSCVNNSSLSFSVPSDMAVNASGTIAYVTNRANSTVSVCRIAGQSVYNCIGSSGSLFDEPEGITLSVGGLYAYITNAGNDTVTVCNVLQDGTGLLANCALTDGPFHGTGNIGFNSFGTAAYVPNSLLNQVFLCNVNQPDGTLSTCLPSGGTNFAGPAGVVLH